MYFWTTTNCCYHGHIVCHFFLKVVTTAVVYPFTEKAVPLVHFSRNTSFLPRGDLDPVRVRERVNFVTTKSAHPQVSMWISVCTCVCDFNYVHVLVHTHTHTHIHTAAT